MRAALLIVLVSVTANAQTPDWVVNAGRHVEGEDILHFGTGADASSDLAVFKAEQAAIQNLLQECGGFASKEIIPREKYIGLEGGKYRAYARMSITFQACEAAKMSHGQPNPEIIKNQELYKEMISGRRSDVEEKAKKLVQGEAEDLKSAMQADIFEQMDEMGVMQKRIETMEIQQELDRENGGNRIPADYVEEYRKRCLARLTEMKEDYQYQIKHGALTPSQTKLFTKNIKMKSDVCKNMK